MINCIAIDDEPLALELLEDNIKQVPFLNLVGAFSNPLKAMPILEKEKIDLIFLDIQMPGLTGLQFIQTNTKNCMYILITAYERYALEGYNLNVVDYLVKPVELTRFIQACNKANELYQLRNQPAPTAAAEVSPASNFIFVNADYSQLKIDKQNILWIEGLKDYVKIHLQPPHKPIVTRIAMGTIESDLGAGFARVHKSFIISLAALTSYKKSSVLVGDMELPLSDSYRESFFKAIGREES